MRRILLFISLLVSIVGFAQTPPVQSIGNTTNEVKARGFLSADTGYIYRNNFADTTAANTNTYLKYQAGAVIRTGDLLWMRNAARTRWLPFGSGNVVVDTTSSISLAGNGSVDYPLAATLIVSQQENNAVQSLSDGLYVPTSIQNGVISGGIVTWVSGYTYDVSPVFFVINNVQYSVSNGGQVTLPNSDPSLDRVDDIVAETSETVDFVEGIPAEDPLQPSVDVTTQMPLAFILVTAGSTQPTVNQKWIYINNTEWTTLASTARINPASTNNPYSATLDVEGTAVQNGDNIRYTDPTPPTDMTLYNVLTFKLRSKAVWANTSRIDLRWYDGATPLGTTVSVANNSYGFQSSQTSSYQTISIPLSNFGAVSSPTALLMTITTVGGQTIGFYIDDIQLQDAEIPTFGNFWALGGNVPTAMSSFGTNNNLSIPFITNNTERMRLLNSGALLVGATTPFSSSNKLEVHGETFIGGSVSNGVNLMMRNTSLTNSTTFRFGAKTSLNVTAANWPITEGLQGYFLGNNLSVTSSTWNSNSASTTWGQFFPLNTSSPTALVYATGISTSASISVESVEYMYMDRRIFNPLGTKRLIFNTTIDDGTTLFQTSGSMKFSGLSTDNTSTQVLAKDASGLNVWRDASTLGGISAITADNGLTANTSTNVRLGGSLLTNTTITATGLNLTIDGTNSFGVLYLKSTTGTPLVAEATGAGGQAIMGMVATDNTYAISTFKNTPSTNTVLGVMVAQRTTTGTAADGIGGSFDFFNELANGSSNVSNKLISKWTTADFLTRKAQFIITGIHNAVEYDLFTLSSTGATRLNNYGIGTFTGTAAYTLQVDASGNIIEGAVGGGTYTASNGLTMTANNTKLGGDLIENTTVGNIAQDFGLTVSRIGTSASVSLAATSSVGVAINSTSGSGNALISTSTSGLAGVFSINPSSTNTLDETIRVARTSSGTPANGIGGSINFTNEVSDNSQQLSARIGSTFTDVTLGTRTGDLQFWTTNSATSAIKATLAGSGALRLHNYGVNTFAGVAAYVLAVDASGNVVEVAAAGAGMTNVLTTTGDIIYSSSGTTPARLGIGTSGQVLTVSGGGIPEWTTVVGTGSVTDVSWTGGIVSIATSTTTPAFTIAGTSGGIPYFSSSSAWASSAALADNAIVIGGGAGNAPETTTTGTGVLTALGVNVGSAGAFVVFDGALGTPSSGVATNLTGTATALNIGGNAATATILQTARTINGTSFDGSTNITVTAAAGTLTGTTLNATVVTSSLTAVGTIATGVWQGTAIGDTYISSAATWNAKQTGDATLTALAGLTITNGSIIYGTGADAFAVLAAGTNGHVLTLAGGVPTWAAAGSGTVTSVAMSVPSFLSVSGSPITGAGTFAVTLSGTALPAANGGTGLTAYGSSNQMLGMNSGGTALEYKTISAANGVSVTHAANSIVVSTVFNPTVQTLTDGATITWNVTNGGNAVVTLNGTGRTLSITNPVAGYTYTVRIIQGSGGSKTITTWPTNTKWPGGTAPTLSTTASDYDVIVLFYDGTNYYGTYETDFS